MKICVFKQNQQRRSLQKGLSQHKLHRLSFSQILYIQSKKKEENTQLVFERESVQLVRKTIDLMLFLFVL